MTMASTTALRSLRTVLKALGASGGLADEQVLRSDFVSVRPDGGYITIGLLSDRRVGSPERFLRDDGGTDKLWLRERREGTFSVQAFGETAGGWLDRFVSLLTSDTGLALTAAEGVTLRLSGAMRDITALVDTGREKRYLQEIVVDYSRSTLDTAPETPTVVSQVVVTQTLQDSTIASVDPDALEQTTTITV